MCQIETIVWCEIFLQNFPFSEIFDWRLISLLALLLSPYVVSRTDWYARKWRKWGNVDAVQGINVYPQINLIYRGGILIQLTWKCHILNRNSRAEESQTFSVDFSLSLLFLREYLFLGQVDTRTVLQLDEVQTPSCCKASAPVNWPWTGHWIPTSSRNTALYSDVQSYLRKDAWSP